MPRRNPSIASFAALLAGLLPMALGAQVVPISDELSLCPASDQPEPGPYFCGSPAAAVVGDSFRVASDWQFVGSESHRSTVGCQTHQLSSAGDLLAREILESGSVEADVMPEAPAVAGLPGGRFLAAWHVVLFARADVHFQILGGGGPPAGEPRSVGTPGDDFCQWAPDVAANAAGAFVLGWEESAGCRVDSTTIAVQAFDAAGQPVTPVLHPAAGSRPRVAIDATGRFLVVWGRTGQRYGRGGQPLGAPFHLGAPGSGGRAAVAMEPSGAFAAAWSEPAASGPRLRLQWFSSTAAPVGPAVEVAAGVGAEVVDLRLDRHGNLALLAQEGGALRLYLFNRALVRQGPPAEIPFAPPAFAYRTAALALADSGRLLVAWPGPGSPATGRDLLARAFKARHEADLCVRRGDRFRCDTAGDGGAAEAVIAFGVGGSREVPLLADVDGDGRADPCVVRSGRLLCDTAHDGGAAEMSIPLATRTGDRPLLGDIDGDGRADPCVRRGTLLLCDRARDGGAFDRQIDFGRAGDPALLGDVNLDRRADLCVYRQGRFLCDTGQNGGAAETTLDLRPALVGIGPGIPLLGDVNSDGRADACLYAGGQLTCGVFPTRGGTPLRVIRLTFGEPGDVPLLGDLDAF